MKPISEIVLKEAEKILKKNLSQIQQLPLSGSERIYFRTYAHDNSTYIAVFNDNTRENIAFKTLTLHFLKNKIKVPDFYGINNENTIYVIEDLGNTTLFDLVQKEHQNTNEACNYELYYKKSIEQLISMQIDASNELPFEVCYPVEKFNYEAIMWDLNYFKYCFLKPAGIKFEEDLLQNDFNTLCNLVSQSVSNFFMFRDFQSRNIMIKNDEVYFIDYQGGRKGPIEYDIASLVLDAKANLPYHFREELIDFYFSEVSKKISISRDTYDKNISLNLLIRILQAFGAYGFRGLIQKKELFINSIPLAAQNLKNFVLPKINKQFFPYLIEALNEIIEKFSVQKENHTKNYRLTVTIVSFSYKKGIPQDKTDNGGGFVFDCRSLPNPGRLMEMQTKTGYDEEVANILQQSTELKDFLLHTTQLVKNTIKNYLERKFTHLMVCYGCTGGQHRSVFCANYLSNEIEKEFSNQVIVNLIHRELQ